ncbi:MAG: DUF1963 domain-containing protein [Pseudomonadota bacterium]
MRPTYPPTREEFAQPTYFGGHPELPRALDWPRMQNGTPMMFLAQVDLADLPRDLNLPEENLPELDLLPRSGRLWFFAELAEWSAYEEDPDGIRVLFDPAPRDLARRMPPEDLTGHYQDNLLHVWDEDHFPDRRPKACPHVPIKAVPYRSMPTLNRMKQALEERGEGGKYRDDKIMESLYEYQEQSLVNLFGPLGPGILYGEPLTPLAIPWIDDQKQPGAFALGEDYPWCWLVVDCTAQSVAARAQRFRRDPSRMGWDAEIEHEALDWISRADAAGPFAPLQKRERNAFRQWQDRLADTIRDVDEFSHTRAERRSKPVRDHLNRLIGRPFLKPSRPGPRKMTYHTRQTVEDGLRSAIAYVLGHPGQAVLPSALLDQMRTFFDERHLLDGGAHQMLGAPKSVQNVHDSHADKILLLQLIPDRRLGWQWGDLGSLQFWIDPQDLAAQRFDRVSHTLESH